ncbi:MAG: HD domain-containing protein [Candidatus Omnitrophota bacterium]
MDSFFAVFNDHKEIFKKISALAENKNIKLYLVGGVLRDALLGRKKDNPDIDFCLRKGAINFGRLAASELKSGFVVLDRIHGCARVVYKYRRPDGAGGICTLDFTDFRGKTLEEDLLHRDFTINSLALELGALLSRMEKRRLSGKAFAAMLLDPYHGIEDLRARVIRLVNKRGYDEDPLRILRAFSLSAIFEFAIDKETLRRAIVKRKKLSAVSPERVRDELFKVFSSHRAYESLVSLEKNKLLELIVPEIKPLQKLDQGQYHHLDVLGHTLETVKHLELIFQEFRRRARIHGFLNEEISSGRRRYALMILAALLHDVGKPRTLRVRDSKIMFHGHERVGAFMAEDISVRLKLSNDETRRLKQIIFAHLRPGYLADSSPSERARFRFFRDTASEALSVLLISLADQRATSGPQATAQSRLNHERLVQRLIRVYCAKKDTAPALRLVDGNDIMRRFTLEASPLIGSVLSELQELQAIGKIKTREEALRAAAALVKHSKALVKG